MKIPASMPYNTAGGDGPLQGKSVIYCSHQYIAKQTQLLKNTLLITQIPTAT